MLVCLGLRIMQWIVRHYAQALEEVARSHACLEEVHESLIRMSDCLRRFPECMRHLSAVHFSFQRSRPIILELSQHLQLHDGVRNFLLILKRERRFALLFKIVACFHERYTYPDGFVPCKIDTACPLTGPQKRALQKQLLQFFQKPIAVVYGVQPDMKGGWILRTPEQKIDGSTRQRVHRILHSVTLNATQ